MSKTVSFIETPPWQYYDIRNILAETSGVIDPI